MVIAKAEMHDGRQLVLIGLSAENVRRLQAGQPIRLDTAELNIAPGDTIGILAIHYAETEEKFYEAMGDLIGPDTIVRGTPGGR